MAATHPRGSHGGHLKLARLTKRFKSRSLFNKATCHNKRGTDGEDGPTNAAGAWIDERVAKQATQCATPIEESLQRNDAYHFFEPLGALLKTGPTHTNVCDLRVVTVERQQ